MDTAALDFSVLAPIGFVSIGAMLVLMLEVWLSRGAAAEPGTRSSSSLPDSRIGTALAIVATLSLVLALYAAMTMFASGIEGVFNPARPMLRLDPLSSFATALVALGALLSVWLSITYLPALHINHGEYYALLLLSTAGMFVLVSAVDLIALFLGLELMSIPVYVLAGFDRSRLRSNESALKYFLLGSFASAILLYGAALLYGATGHTGFAGVRAGFEAGGALSMAGLGLVVVGLAFKIAAVPFHQWSPDVYEGAPTSVTAFMSVTIKTAAFVVLLRFLLLALPEVSVVADRVNALFWVLAAATMIVGNLMAVIQTNVKRLLAYSSIAHAGYLLVGLASATTEAHAAILFYLFVYLFMSLGAFGVVVALAQGGRECDRIDDFAGLAARRPALAAVMTLFLLSMAGIPGTAGFMAKFHLFLAAVNADQIVLVILGVLTSVVSLFYYLRLPMVMYMRDAVSASSSEVSSSELLVLGICAAAVLYFAFFPSGDPWSTGIRALDFARQAAASLH